MPNKTFPKLVLSSSSPARRELLTRLQIPFVTTSPDVDESCLPNENIEEMVLRLAELKARASVPQYPDAFIIGCDIVGALDDTILGKPLTYENAVTQLRLMSGKKCRFFIGLCVLDARKNHFESALETFDVHMRELSDTMIQNYLRQENTLQCAGSIHVEALGIALIEKLEGDDYTGLIGLPLIQLVSLLRKLGIEVL
jgi:septum formation protein